MSRIGKLPITIPKGVEVSVTNNKVSVKGAKTTLHQQVDEAISIKVDSGIVSFTRNSELKHAVADPAKIASFDFRNIPILSKPISRQEFLAIVGRKIGKPELDEYTYEL